MFRLLLAVIGLCGVVSGAWAQSLLTCQYGVADEGVSLGESCGAEVDLAWLPAGWLNGAALVAVCMDAPGCEDVRWTSKGRLSAGDVVVSSVGLLPYGDIGGGTGAEYESGPEPARFAGYFGSGFLLLGMFWALGKGLSVVLGVLR